MSAKAHPEDAVEEPEVQNGKTSSLGSSKLTTKGTVSGRDGGGGGEGQTMPCGGPPTSSATEVAKAGLGTLVLGSAIAKESCQAENKKHSKT